MTRVALLTEIPAPYRIPLFNALAERVDLDVLFLAERNPLRPYRLHEDELRFRWEVLSGRDVAAGSRWVVLNRGVRKRVRSADATIIGGWNQPAFWTALAAPAPAHLWVESTLRDRRSGSGGALKRALARRAAGFIVPGRASLEYVRTLAPSARVVTAPNAVDNELFGSGVARSDIEGICILYVGRLAPEKGVDMLLRAAEGLDATVVVAGSGPEEARLRAIAPPGTRFLGNVERDDLPALYAGADMLVLPSLSEPWGMPLNEGAAAGLPLVSTDAAGAAYELIEDGINGFRVRAGEPAALQEALAVLVADDAFRRAAGEHSREIASRFTPAAWADAVAGTVTVGH
jgi:glycosyltransferase involved in cell wall biosynthesis